MNARSLAAAAVLAAPALAADADVVSAKATRTGETWRFEVTVRHGDEGHYADEWRIVGSDGTVYRLSVLLHPHVEEQPFTRSLDRVAIPPGVRGVTARQHAWPAARA